MSKYFDKEGKRVWFVPLFMHGQHPLLRLWYLQQHMKAKKAEDKIPKESLYCYDETGRCPFMRVHYAKYHALSPFAGFRWCTFLNDGDVPEFNDRCKICYKNLPADWYED